jgi:hypothetical protein
MKSIFAFIVLIVVVVVNEAKRAPSLVDPDSYYSDGDGSGSGDDYDDGKTFLSDATDLWYIYHSNKTDFSSEESKEKENNVRSFDGDILLAKSEFVGRCVENCNEN